MIIQPALMSSLITGIDALCFGDSTGMAWVTAGGGSAPYTYLWNNGSTNDTISGLNAGAYWVIITDTAGCTISDTVTIGQPTPINTLMGSTPTLCAGTAVGVAWVNASGGTAPYTYLWNNTSTNDTISGLVAGTYWVTVTDSNGCTTSDTIVVTEPSG